MASLDTVHRVPCAQNNFAVGASNIVRSPQVLEEVGGHLFRCLANLGKVVESLQTHGGAGLVPSLSAPGVHAAVVALVQHVGEVQIAVQGQEHGGWADNDHHGDDDVRVCVVITSNSCFVLNGANSNCIS